MTNIKQKIAPTFTEDEDVKKGFFDLGWDYYSHKQGLPNEVKRYPSMIDGYNAASLRVKPVRGDRHTLKWLQIRFGALRRDRVFDESVTVDYLKSIDVDYCPITGALLTRSGAPETNWSIDRICNEVGYVAGNLVVVSAKANKAKSTMSVEDIHTFLADGGSDYRGLSPQEWMRWLFISSMVNSTKNDKGEVDINYVCAPAVMECPPNLSLNASILLQNAIAKKASGFNYDNFFAIIINGLPKSQRRMLNELVHDAGKLQYMVHANHHIYSIWYNTKLFKKFNAFYQTLPMACRQQVISNAHKTRIKYEPIVFETDKWDPETKGYNQHKNEAHNRVHI